MATAAFKSTSRRPNSSSSSSSSLKDTTSPPNTSSSSSSSSNKPPPRRSRSVSAVPRSHPDSSSLSSSSDFLIKRDNPLYWSTVSPPENEISHDLPSVRKSSTADDRRGRSVSRNRDAPSRDSARVLPKVDTGRRRSVSRGPVSRSQPLSTQSDAEGVNLLARYRNGSDSDSSASRKNITERSYVHHTLDQVKSLPVSPRDSPIKSQPNFGWDNKGFGSSFPEDDKRCAQKKSLQEIVLEDDASSCIYETVRSEVRLAIADIKNDLERAIVRSNATAVTSADIVNLPPDLVNPGAVELVLDIRREYSRKLEQSLERARKLREELEVEEHRGLELRRILKEVLPDPKNSNIRRSRQGRKSSIERRKMSHRLTEEAIAYFDECISLSTFDSSDFESQDEPPISIVGNNAHIGDCTSLAEANTSVATIQCSPDYKQESDTTSSDILGIPAATSRQPTSDERGVGNIETRRFSFARNRHQIGGEYVKNVGEMPLKSRSSLWDVEEYNIQASSETFLFDTLLLNNKIESGAILLCGGGITISLSPFAYVI